jgi:hypothetical protein
MKNETKKARGTGLIHEQIDIEMLAQMQEDELGHLLSQLEYRQRRPDLANRRECEEDIAYVQREVQIRRARTRAHAEWLMRNPWANRREEAPAQAN